MLQSFSRLLLLALIVAAALTLPPVPNTHAQSAELMKVLQQCQALSKASKYKEGIPCLERLVELIKKEYGPTHKITVAQMNNLAGLYKSQGRYNEAEPLYRRALQINEKALGADHPSLAAGFTDLARLYKSQRRYNEAEPLYRRALQINKKALGANHPLLAASFSNLAGLYKSQGRYNEAEPLYWHALKIEERGLGPDHLLVATTLNNFALLYAAQGRNSEAEPLYKRALKIEEKALGPDHSEVATTLINFAGTYAAQGRYFEAELLYRRAVKINEKMLGPDHASLAAVINNLALLYVAQGRYKEAEPLYKRALKITKKALGRRHPSFAASLNNLAMLYAAQGRYSEAELLYVYSLKIKKKALGPDHPELAATLNNLGSLYESQERYSEAELLYKRALKIIKKVQGPDNPELAAAFNNLAGLYFAQNDWRQAVASWREATAILTRRAKRSGKIGRGVTGKKKSEVAQNNRFFRNLVKSVFRHDSAEKAGREMFETAQWAIGSQAAGALAQMSARKAAGSGELAALVRERQDSVRTWQSNEKRMNALRGAGKSDKKLEAQMARLDKRIAQIDKRLAKDFPNYAALASPKPLTIKQVQKLLGPNEALVLLLDTPKFFSGSKLITPAETFVWAITREQAIWKRAPLGGKALADKVARLRCGLDGSNWADPSGWPDKQQWDIEAKAAQQIKRDKCIALIGATYTDRDWPPFPFDTAFELYQTLLAPVEQIIKGKKLLVAASGSLTGLPLQILLTDKTQSKGPSDAKAYQNAPWLMRDHAITTLPSVASLKALRGVGKKGARAKQPLIAFGDPLFNLPGKDIAPSASASKAKADQCGKLTRTASRTLPRSVTRSYASFFKGRNASLATLAQSLPQLDGTHCELNAIAKVLNIKPQSIRLGRAASEQAVKKAALDQYRIVYFATHGLIAGDVKGLGEPALAFSLPAKASPLDDGLLTASEVTDLKLNADWLVMSACNTAAGDKPGAQALSGLARAFFYAGAKTLLVSHWPVGDAAAVRLTTHAFKNMQDNPELGKAQALRQSMLAMINKSKLANTHPTSWAPFVIVGEGGRFQ